MALANPDVPADAVSRLRIRRDEVVRPPSSLSRVIRFLVVSLLLCAVCGAAVAGAVHLGWMPGLAALLVVPDALRSRPEVRVAAVSVETGRSADATVVATGYIESRRQASIGARAPGRIQEIGVEEGSRVTQDQLLAVLEHSDLDAGLAAAAATLERTRAEQAEHEVLISRTRRDLDRSERLRTTGAINESDFDNTRFQYDAAVARRPILQAATALAEARVREAEQLRENMFIRAPFDGTVISRDAEVGESILPGGMGEASGRGSVVMMADLDHLEVDCDVKEDYIGRVTEEQSAEVVVDAVPDRRYRGRVRKIIPMGDRARATVKVKVEITDSDGRLFPEMGSTVFFLPDVTQEPAETDRPRMFTPSAAVSISDGETFVWIVDSQGRAQRLRVTAGATHDDRTEITEGLAGGEKVILSPPAELREGLLVRIPQ